VFEALNQEGVFEEFTDGPSIELPSGFRIPHRLYDVILQIWDSMVDVIDVMPEDPRNDRIALQEWGYVLAAFNARVTPSILFEILRYGRRITDEGVEIMSGTRYYRETYEYICRVCNWLAETANRVPQLGSNPASRLFSREIGRLGKRHAADSAARGINVIPARSELKDRASPGSSGQRNPFRSPSLTQEENPRDRVVRRYVQQGRLRHLQSPAGYWPTLDQVSRFSDTSQGHIPGRYTSPSGRTYINGFEVTGDSTTGTTFHPH
jgi:hypothetical protein